MLTISFRTSSNPFSRNDPNVSSLSLRNNLLYQIEFRHLYLLVSIGRLTSFHSDCGKMMLGPSEALASDLLTVRRSNPQRCLIIDYRVKSSTALEILQLKLRKSKKRGKSLKVL